MTGEDRLAAVRNRLRQLRAHESTQHREALHIANLLVDARREMQVQVTQLIGHPLLLDARADAGMEQHRIERLRQVALRTELDAGNDRGHLVDA